MILTNWLNEFDLVPAFLIASGIGVGLCIQVMIEISHERIGSRDHMFVRNLRRTGVLLVSLALLESLIFGYDRSWQPWPPHLMLIVGLDVWLLGVVVSAYSRNRRDEIVGLLRRHDDVY